jgi:hypothetical protein
MQRGILSLTKSEIVDVANILPLEKYLQTPLYNKIITAVQIDESVSSIDIEISEEELEIILDEMGIPNIETDTEAIKSARTKINQLLVKFRETQY